jgi:hypothetical protein
MIDTRFSPYAGLLNYSYDFYNGKTKHTLDCWLEFEDSDDSVGLAESWAVFYAYLGGVDISELLSEEIKADIIEQARLTFESFANEGDY